MNDIVKNITNSNIIAVIWDFDNTLINGNMQKPIFDKYKKNGKLVVTENDFWKEISKLPEQIWNDQKVKVNPDTIYLNQFIRDAKPDGRFAYLSNDDLFKFGSSQTFFNGVEDFFKKLKYLNIENKKWLEFNIVVENYIVSTGFAQTIRGTSIAQNTDGIWGCELIENKIDGKNVISEIGYTIDNSTKTRAIFEINKGINFLNKEDKTINVNSKIPKEFRRVPFENMIYIADGPSDVPAFSLINKFGGSTFAVYKKGNIESLKQVEDLRMQGRIDMYAEADYSKDTTAYMWILNKIDEIANRIMNDIMYNYKKNIKPSPKHLY